MDAAGRTVVTMRPSATSSNATVQIPLTGLADGTYTVHDPTSSSVTAKTWDADTLASASTGKFYALTKMAS